MKYIFLVNSFSVGNKIDIIINRINSYCKKNYIDYVIEINSKEKSTEDILKKYKYSENFIIPIGGDGIINRTLNSIMNTKNILGFIPYGTGNDFYKTVISQFREGLNKCDVIKVNNKFYINTLCFGIDADIANNKKLFDYKFIPKKYKYGLGILYTFFKYRKKYFEIKLNGENIKGYFTTVVVCNGCYYGGGYNVSPNSNLNDDTIEVLSVPYTNKLLMLKLILSMKKGKHLNSKYIKVFNSKKLEIKSNEKCRANIDGKVLVAKKFNIQIIKDGIEVFYNKKLIDEITSLN